MAGLISTADPIITYSEDALIVSPLDWNRFKEWARKITSVSSTYTIKITDNFINASSAGGAFTLTLPSAVSYPGMEFTVFKADTGASIVTLSAIVGELINGALTYTAINAQYEWVRVKSNGIKWCIIGIG